MIPEGFFFRTFCIFFLLNLNKKVFKIYYDNDIDSFEYSLMFIAHFKGFGKVSHFLQLYSI